ncbi:hypothetical protein PINS_up023769 [Pythium insidiosum]|nr:hypothetical protein PINS_up023769 [Pythium insidiosum]
MQDLLSVDTSEFLRHERRSSHRRQCGAPECSKYALSGGYCISHGGGKPCRIRRLQHSRAKRWLCKAHGGGSKCKSPRLRKRRAAQGFLHGCMAAASPARSTTATNARMAVGSASRTAAASAVRQSGARRARKPEASATGHGGGKRCSAPECFQAARKGGRCIRHRGGEYRMTGRNSSSSSTWIGVIAEGSDEVAWKECKSVWENEDVQDTANVDELSELFSAIEEESDDAVDFSF